VHLEERGHGWIGKLVKRPGSWESSGVNKDRIVKGEGRRVMGRQSEGNAPEFVKLAKRLWETSSVDDEAINRRWTGDAQSTAMPNDKRDEPTMVENPRDSSWGAHDAAKVDLPFQGRALNRGKRSEEGYHDNSILMRPFRRQSGIVVNYAEPKHDNGKRVPVVLD
jgi:hypothetical protein